MAIGSVFMMGYAIKQKARMQTLRENFISHKEISYSARLAVAAGPHEVGVTFRRKPAAVPEYVNRPFQVAGSLILGSNAKRIFGLP